MVADDGTGNDVGWCTMTPLQRHHARNHADIVVELDNANWTAALRSYKASPIHDVDHAGLQNGAIVRKSIWQMIMNRFHHLQLTMSKRSYLRGHLATKRGCEVSAYENPPGQAGAVRAGSRDEPLHACTIMGCFFSTDCLLPAPCGQSLAANRMQHADCGNADVISRCNGRVQRDTIRSRHACFSNGQLFFSIDGLAESHGKAYDSA